VDASDHVELKRLQIREIGEEAIHIRPGSKNTLIEDCDITGTGLVYPGFGEGMYVGSDKSVWNLFAPDVGFATIKNCRLGPNIRGEAFDVKEGSFETIIEDCTVDATGLSGQNFADNFIDLKGTRTYVRFNTFNQNGAIVLTKGVAVIDREVNLSAEQNVIHDDVFKFDNDSSIRMVEAGSRTTATIVYDNARVPSNGAQYSGGVTQSCCPSWYKRPSIYVVCFSGDTTVVTSDRGKILMKDLQLGDKILTSSNSFEPVYSFGHRHEFLEATYLKILPSKLEVSRDHMVFVDGGRAIPASLLQVGDKLLNGDLITAIQQIVGTGVYAPFTPSGTLLVNGVPVSSYVAFQGSEHLMLGKTLLFSYQWLAHTFQVPHRLWCHQLARCSRETYTEAGVSTWVDLPLHLTRLWLEEERDGTFTMLGVIVPLTILLMVMSFLELAMIKYLLAAVFGLLGWWWLKTPEPTSNTRKLCIY
jgi:hypothetical protein